MIITRDWAMPNHNTFSIPPIKKFIERNITDGIWLDPFSRNSPFCEMTVTNDLSVDFKADYHMECLDFLKMYVDNSVDGILFDPPYSPRQISEVYKSVGREVHMKDTQSSFYAERKKECARIIKTGGKFMCFGWNSGGIGKSLGFDLQEILLVAHGGAHNDTICTMEVKL